MSIFFSYLITIVQVTGTGINNQKHKLNFFIDKEIFLLLNINDKYLMVINHSKSAQSNKSTFRGYYPPLTMLKTVGLKEIYFQLFINWFLTLL